jgi:hypothetical protein
MCLLAMNWKQNNPPDSFIGFAVEYMEPGRNQFYALTIESPFLVQMGN